jgi:hypothetical protein
LLFTLAHSFRGLAQTRIRAFWESQSKNTASVKRPLPGRGTESGGLKSDNMRLLWSKKEKYIFFEPLETKFEQEYFSLSGLSEESH